MAQEISSDDILGELRRNGVIADRLAPDSASGRKSANSFLIEDALRFQARVRGGGFRELHKWIETCDGLFLRASQTETLTVIRLDTFAGLINGRLLIRAA